MLPCLINPMLAQKAVAPFDSEEHLFEIKWDGIRCLAFIEGGRVRLQSRQLTEITFQFPELGCLGRLRSGTVLDGELIVLREGKPSLRDVQKRAALQSRPRIQVLSQLTPASYIVFDVLYLKGKPLLAAPLIRRRELLHELIQQTSLPGIFLPDGVVGHGAKLFAEVARLNLEGIMAKRLDSPYLPGKRSRHWRKIKTAQVREHEIFGRRISQHAN